MSVIQNSKSLSESVTNRNLSTMTRSVWYFDGFRKFIMALTGLLLFGFFVGHLFGNFYALQGHEAYDQYYQWLGNSPILHWFVRLSVIIAIPLHIWAAVSIAATNHKARPVGYRKHRYQASNIASRTMIITGSIFLLFLIVHLSQMRFGLLGPGGDSAWAKLQWGLNTPWVLVLYVLGLLALATHLFHGLWSIFQTLSLNNPRTNPWRLRFAIIAGPGLVLCWLLLLALLLWGA